MNRDDYRRIRDKVYKNAGIDKFDFDLMMFRVVNKAVQEEREACAVQLDEMAAKDRLTNYYKVAANAIRARGQE